MTHYEILPKEQRVLLPDLKPAQDVGYALYGGTAAALRLGHRQSVDFDFFTAHHLDEAELVQAMPFLADAVPLQRQPETLTVQVQPLGPGTRPVKLSFFGGLSFGRVGTPTLTAKGEILVASGLDLLGHKLKVLLQRVESKDYRDIAALLRSGLRLEAGLGAAQALFKSVFPPSEALRALTYFQGGDLDTLRPDDRKMLETAAGRSGPIIPATVLAPDLTVDKPKREQPLQTRRATRETGIGD